MTPPKEHGNIATDLKEMEIHEWPDKKFKIIVLKILKNIRTQKDNLVKSATQYNEKFNKGIENMKRTRSFGAKEYSG